MLTQPKQSIAKFSKGNANAKGEQNLEEGSLKAEQPRAPSAHSPSPIPHIGAAALAQGEGPQPTGNDQTKIVHYSDSLLPMSGPPPSTPEPKQAFLDTDPSFTPSHLRHLNNPTLSFNGYAGCPVSWRSCLEIGNWNVLPWGAAPPRRIPLRLEVPDVNILQFAHDEYDWDDVLEAVSSLDCKSDQISALKLFSDLLNTEVSGMDHTQAALLRRNCARLHILLHQPTQALDLCNLNFQVDGEDVRTERISRRACSAIKELEGSWRTTKLRTLY